MTGLRRYKNRRDANEPEIVSALERMGCLVYRLNKPVDLLVKFPGWDFVLPCEVKTLKGKLTDEQQAFRDAGWHFEVLRTVEDAYNLFNTVRRIAA